MAYATQNQKVWDYLNKYGSITALEMFEEFFICHPPSRIRDLRKQYGYETITYEWLKKVVIEKTLDGKEHKTHKRYKRYILNKIETS